MNLAGDGSIISHLVTDNGEVEVRVMGKDRRDGRWASFSVLVPWSEWCALNESAYNQREEIAQQRIPY